MSSVKIVEKAFDVASRRNISRYNREGMEVYRIENIGTLVQLFHYNTRTLAVKEGRVLLIYGESRSDVDSINTVLSKLNLLEFFSVGYKPVNGGFYAYIRQSREELYLGNYNNTVDFAKEIQKHLENKHVASPFSINFTSEMMPAI